MSKLYGSVTSRGKSSTRTGTHEIETWVQTHSERIIIELTEHGVWCVFKQAVIGNEATGPRIPILWGSGLNVCGGEKPRE